MTTTLRTTEISTPGIDQTAVPVKSGFLRPHSPMNLECCLYQPWDTEMMMDDLSATKAVAPPEPVPL